MLNDGDTWPIRCTCGHTTHAEIGWLWNLDTFECAMCRAKHAFDKDAFRDEVKRTRQHVGNAQRSGKGYLGERV
jgi:hypothetical protein